MMTEQEKLKKNTYQRAWRAKNPHKVKEYNDRSVIDHHESRLEYSKKYYNDNREKCIARNKAWQIKNAEIRKEYRRKWRLDNIDKIRATRNARNLTRYKTDPAFRILCRLRTRLHKTTRKALAKKGGTFELLGCTMPEFLLHLESTFTDGMTWEKFMTGALHIDHVRPLALYDLTDRIQQKEAFGYLNTQALWATDNLKKGRKLTLDNPSVNGNIGDAAMAA